MKKKITYLFLFAVVGICSCGGVVGNIQKYTFPNTTSNELKKAIDSVYIKYPNLIKNDTTKYGNNDGTDYYFLLEENSNRYVFICNIVSYPPPYDKEVDLSLTRATEWGETLNLAPKTGYFNKRKYRKLFEKYILPKIEAIINNEKIKMP